MSQGYQTYEFLTDRLTRTVRQLFLKLGMKKEADKKHFSPTIAMKYLYTQHPGMKQTLDTTVLAEERYWMKNSRKAIFPESGEILDKLLKAKFELKTGAGVRMPYESFMLAFPKDYKIAGRRAEGCLVTFIKHNERRDTIYKGFFGDLGIDLPHFTSGLGAQYDDDFTLQINYAWADFDETAAVKGVARAAVPRTHMPALLAAKDSKEYGRLLGSFEGDLVHDTYALDEKDTEYQFELLRIVAAFAIYTGSIEETLVEGYPGVPPKNMTGMYIPKSDNLTMRLHSDMRSERGAHYRTWHFRQLSHEKYYQGEFKNMERGSRVVFVRDTMVNAEIEAETLKDVAPRRKTLPPLHK